MIPLPLLSTMPEFMQSIKSFWCTILPDSAITELYKSADESDRSSVAIDYARCHCNLQKSELPYNYINVN